MPPRSFALIRDFLPQQSWQRGNSVTLISRHGHGDGRTVYIALDESRLSEGEMRGAWDASVTAAGLPGLLLHDFRRSAVRNMIRAGVPQKTAREISGHKTDAVFNRYNITSEADIRGAARKLEPRPVIHSFS